MGHEKDCLYSVNGICILSDKINKIFDDIRSDLSPDLNDEEILKMIDKRFPEKISSHISNFNKTVKGSTCFNCSLRKHV